MYNTKTKRIFLIGDTKGFTGKCLKNEDRKLTKGLLRNGHDVQFFNYREAFFQGGALMSLRIASHRCKTNVVDKLLEKQLKNYCPDIVFVRMVNYVDGQTVRQIRHAAPSAPIIGLDNNLWPELHDHCLDAAKNLDLMVTTYDGNGLDAYRKTGVRCAFLPSNCDPDIEHRYEVSDEWKSDILFTGQERQKHRYYSGQGEGYTEETRHKILCRLSEMKNCALYGCCGRPKIEGINYFYAISGTKIALSINAVNNIKLCHSDRFTTYLACGAFVLAKRVPDSDLLFKDGVHLRYFDTVDEFFDLAKWYLENENERRKIASAGMERAQTEFNCTKMAGYLLDLVEKGSYSAPWTQI